jgi:YVTN family beta-propeller protein
MWVSARTIAAGVGVILVGALPRAPHGATARRPTVDTTVHTVVVGHRPFAVGIDEQAGRVFVSNSQDDTVSVLDAATGAVLRTVRVGHVPDHIAILARRNRAYILDAGAFPADDPARGGVTILNATSGTVLHSTPLGKGARFLATDAPLGRIFVVNVDSGSLSAVNADTGHVLQTIAVGDQPGGVAVDERTHRVFVAGFVGQNGDGAVRVLDGRTGALVRTLRFPQLPATPVVDEGGGRVYIGLDESGKIAVLDSHTGNLTRTFGVKTPNQVLLDASAHRLCAFGEGIASVMDVTTGTIIRNIKIGVPGEGAVDSIRGLFYLVDDSNSVIVLDARTGRMVRRVKVGQVPEAVAVDTKTGRAFVVNTGGNTVSVLDAPH